MPQIIQLKKEGNLIQSACNILLKTSHTHIHIYSITEWVVNVFLK